MSGFLDNTQINYVFEKEGREEGGQGGSHLSRPLLAPQRAMNLGMSGLHLPGLCVIKGLAREVKLPSVDSWKALRSFCRGISLSF